MTDIRFREDMGVSLVEVYGSEHTIVAAARVSLGNDEIKSRDEPLTKADMGLLRRLFVDYHGTPFEKAGFIFKLEAPLFVMHQLQRHRWSSFNEQSGRYVDFEPVFYSPSSKNIRKQSGKRMDYAFEDLEKANPELAQAAYENIRTAQRIAYSVYEKLLSQGVAREQARSILPVSVYTAAYWTINVRSLSNFLFLRLDKHAQKEIRELAQKCYDIFQEHFPYVSTLYKEIAMIRPEFDLDGA